jgi:hypothetical protein
MRASSDGLELRFIDKRGVRGRKLGTAAIASLVPKWRNWQTR